MAKSKRERLATALAARGYTPNPESRTTRALELCAVNTLGVERKAFLGKAGSVRIGRLLSESRPVSDADMTLLLAQGDKLLADGGKPPPWAKVVRGRYGGSRLRFAK